MAEAQPRIPPSVQPPPIPENARETGIPPSVQPIRSPAPGVQPIRSHKKAHKPSAQPPPDSSQDARKPRKHRPSEALRSYWAHATAPAFPTESELESLQQLHKVTEVRWCSEDDAGGLHLFLRRPYPTNQSQWHTLCSHRGWAYLADNDTRTGRAPWQRFADQASESQAAELAVNVKVLVERASQLYAREAPSQAAAEAARTRRAEANVRMERELTERLEALEEPSPDDAGADARIAEAVLDAVWRVPPATEAVSPAPEDEPVPPPPSPSAPPATPFDRYLDGQGLPPAGDPVEAGDAAMRDLASSVKAHWDARGAAPRNKETGPLRGLPLFDDVAWPATPPATPTPRKRRPPRKTLAQRVEEASLGIRRPGRPPGSKTVNRKPRPAGLVWRRVAEPPESPPESPPRALAHAHGSKQPTIREMMSRARTTPMACPPRHRRVQYQQPLAPDADRVRAFLARDDACTPEGGQALLDLVHALLPERIRGHAEFNCNDPTTAFGQLFPVARPAYESYLTQSPELTTVEAHRRTLRLENMAQVLLRALQVAASNDPSAVEALPPAERADLRVALEFAGGAQASGPLFWQAQPPSQEEAPRGPEESTLRPTLEFLRGARAQAFRRTYFVANTPSWALPVLVEIFTARAAGAEASLIHRMTELAEVRLQVKIHRR
jgi:hypothetical protein